jgi:hypothetical protein
MKITIKEKSKVKVVRRGKNVSIKIGNDSQGNENDSDEEENNSGNEEIEDDSENEESEDDTESGESEDDTENEEIEDEFNPEKCYEKCEETLHEMAAKDGDVMYSRIGPALQHVLRVTRAHMLFFNNKIAESQEVSFY